MQSPDPAKLDETETAKEARRLALEAAEAFRAGNEGEGNFLAGQAAALDAGAAEEAVRDEAVSEDRDDALDDTFPASDPPSTTDPSRNVA